MKDVPIDSLEIIGVPVTPYLAGAYDITRVAENERTLVILGDLTGTAEDMEELQRRIEGHDMPKYVPYEINGKLKYGHFDLRSETGYHSIVILR